MAEVIAGWTAGYAMSLVSTFALTILLIQASGSRAIQRYTNGEMSPWFLAVPMSLGAFLVWTIIGLILGSLYKVGGLAEHPGALGAPSAPFLIGVVAIAVMPLPLLFLFFRRQWWIWCGLSASFVLLFGWLMPLMAQHANL
ncbi:MAG: hypothetical protein M0R74_04030 [Dehalococcoidia bacterium]|nr:hypothetical protein [Dehalococcoidia bacterium]